MTLTNVQSYIHCNIPCLESEFRKYTERLLLEGVAEPEKITIPPVDAFAGKLNEIGLPGIQYSSPFMTIDTYSSEINDNYLRFLNQLARVSLRYIFVRHISSRKNKLEIYVAEAVAQFFLPILAELILFAAKKITENQVQEILLKQTARQKQVLH